MTELTKQVCEVKQGLDEGDGRWTRDHVVGLK